VGLVGYLFRSQDPKGLGPATATGLLGIIQITNSRLFNSDGVRNENNELPDCSGIFELSTNLYTDFIQVGNQVFEVVFELRDSVNLEFDLVNILEVNQ
jgi:hypothetical protein